MYTVSSFARPKSSPGAKRASLPPISTTGEDQPLPEDPRTPEARVGRNASMWTDSGGSRAPLVQNAGAGLYDVEEGSDSSLSGRVTRSPTTPMRPSPLGRSNTLLEVSPGRGELNLPKSVHDDYVTAMLRPDGSHLGSPPGIYRSSSAPDKQGQGVGRELFVSSEDDEPGRVIPVHKAKLLEGGKELEDNLRTHLDQVLKVQMEIGRMHRNLEAINGATGEESQEEVDKKRRDALGKREDGLDAIMDELANLSNVLRSYHAQGTPQLSFPQPSTKTAASSPADSDPHRETLSPVAVPSKPTTPTTSATLPPEVKVSPTDETTQPRPRPPVMRSSTTLETSSSSTRTVPKKERKSAWASVFGGGVGSVDPASLQSPMEMEAVDRKRPW